ncbi:hypothetical protein HPB50_022480 [Hyalomma asiaticum]|uniref:Uncharacterized protein n=1 Tax=Hyalomma asiaticum TaxID=266040 RepID=A0ACB7S4N0_HYAAI|nr:hypothetical protein HPB50_022480 [Hyalomma asiaticum]
MNNAEEWRKLGTLTFLAVVVVAVFTLIAYVLPTPRLVRLLTRLCDTADCRRHAALLTRGLNRSIDPCHDFEAYVCSTWKPDDRYLGLSNALDDLAIAWMDGLHELLEQGAKTIPAARKPQALFEACVASAAGQASPEDRQLFSQFLQELSLSWPEAPQSDKVNAASVLVNLALHWDVSLWLRIRVTRHPFVSSARRIVFLPGRKGDARLFAAKHAHVMATGDYIRYWKLVYTFVTGRPPRPDVDKAIKRSAEVQGDAVNVLHQIATLRSHSTTSLFHLSDFDQRESHLEFGRWLVALRGHLRPYAPLTPNDDVLVADAQLRAVTNFLDSTGNADALSHISWHFVQTYYALLFNRELLEDNVVDVGSALDDASFQLRMLCTMEVDAVYSHLMAAIHILVRLSSTAHADSVLSTLTRKASSLANEMSWLEADAREFLALKLETASARIWPPALKTPTTENKDSADVASVFENIYAACPETEMSIVLFWIKARYCLRVRLMAVSQRRYDEEALLPNLTPRLVDYEQQLNVVDVAVAALAAPLYYGHGTLGMLYGGLGFLFSFALMSALDEAYQYVHPNGSVSKSGSWISRNATEALKLRQQCGENPKTKLVMGTDVAAVELSHAVFLEQLLHSYQSNLTVELNDEKVFFMTLCRATCSRKGVMATSWPMVGCNELLANFQGFLDAFNCRKPSPMIDGNQCSFFGSA